MCISAYICTNAFMNVRIFTLFFSASLFFLQPAGFGQKKADRKVAQQLQVDVTYLASDELEGRRTGESGEHKAADYIERRYREADIPAYKGQYRYPFHFIYGKEIGAGTQVLINGSSLKMGDEAFPLPFSNNKHVAGDVLPDVMEQGNIWLIPLYTDQDQASNPHFEWEKSAFDRVKEAQKQGASGVIFFDSYGSKMEPEFSKHSELEQVDIPVVLITHSGYQKYVKQPESASQKGFSVDVNVVVNKVERTGTNVAAYIDNHAPYTVVLGAHYDHLGYGEDGNSLYANAVKEHQIHHGADDNASGTAAVLQMATWVKKNGKKLGHYNYLFLNFSGEELGLYGSKYFVKDQNIDSAHIAYMINMDMVGRLNDSTHYLELGGVGTSPVWTDVVAMGSDFKLKLDSSGVGPSDHTSFYNVGIPVLFFFTGQHMDYHKPSDKAELLNYPGEALVLKYVKNVVTKMDEENTKPRFTATKQTATGGRRSYKVSLGIMPDYSYQDGGVRVDGVTDNKPAMKAGIKQGDIITQLGEIHINGMQSYMEALGKLSPGDKTQVTIMRDGKEMKLPVEMNK